MLFRSFLDNIFNKFSQEDKTITRKYGGTGLGLSITNELVKLLGGEIKIESQKNIGTTITVYLAYSKETNQDMENQAIENQVVQLDNISILLVEDNYLNRLVANNSLKYYNCKVTEAENGAIAIEILKNETFDIILMDIQMPEMGGIEATQIIRNELLSKTPIIALTANAFKTEIDKCKKAGMDDYVTKPFDEDILIETIAKHTVNNKAFIPKTPMPTATSLAIASIEKEFANKKLYDLTAINTLSRGSTAFVNQMIEIFIEQTTETINKVEKAITQNNFKEVSRLIHKIKPSVESLGIITITKEIKLLEKTAKETSDKEQITSLFSVIKKVLEKAVQQLIADKTKE